MCNMVQLVIADIMSNMVNSDKDLWLVGFVGTDEILSHPLVGEWLSITMYSYLHGSCCTTQSTSFPSRSNKHDPPKQQ